MLPGANLNHHPYRPRSMRSSRPLAALAVAAALSLVLPILSGLAAAGPEPPTLLATAYNTERKLARAANGTLYAAITVNASGTPAARVVATSDGIAWSALLPPTTSGALSYHTTLGIDSRGRLHLAWTEAVAGNRQVFYARLEDGRWSLLEQLSHSIGYAGFPSIAVDGLDRPHVVWYGFDGTTYQVYYRRLDSTGWSPERALTSEAVDATNPAIALGPEGFVHIAWFRQTRNFTYNEIAYLRVEGDDVAETRTISRAGVSSTDPSLVVTKNGTVHVVWSAYVAGVQRLQHATRTSGWSGVETISPTNPAARHPSTALDATDRLYVFWEGQDGQIYEQRRSAGWSAPAPLSTGGTNLYPSARWSQDHNPLCGADARIDVIWTREDAGTTVLSYRSLPAPFPCPGEPLQDLTLAYVGVGLLVAAATGFVAVLVWLRWRWYPKPPSGPA